MNPATTLPDTQTAYNNLYENIRAEVFFRKCAAAGYTPNTEAEARAMLETAGSLRQAMGQSKIASAPDSPFMQLKAAVDQQLGIAPQRAAQEKDWAVKQATEYFFQNPELYNSVLSLKAAQAEAIRTQLQSAA